MQSSCKQSAELQLEKAQGDEALGAMGTCSKWLDLWGGGSVSWRRCDPAVVHWATQSLHLLRRLSEDSRGSEWDTRYTRGNPGALTLPSHPGRVSEEVTP